MERAPRPYLRWFELKACRLSAMQASGVDPRDVAWEREQPVYRVYFWGHPRHASDEWRITDAGSVQEVLAWAQARSGRHRTCQVWAEARNEQGLGLLLLSGHNDPTDGSECR
ncbi:MAG: hypothetical protein LH630_02550 [Actinomycetia bacterium]|nr:hypothetical protein [Actinomycetes bacterium]